MSCSLGWESLSVQPITKVLVAKKLIIFEACPYGVELGACSKTSSVTANPVYLSRVQPEVILGMWHAYWLFEGGRNPQEKVQPGPISGTTWQNLSEDHSATHFHWHYSNNDALGFVPCDLQEGIAAQDSSSRSPEKGLSGMEVEGED